MKNYEWKDEDQDRFYVEKAVTKPGHVIIRISNDGVYVPPSEAQNIASAIVGEPVILIKESELPEVDGGDRYTFGAGDTVFGKTNRSDECREIALDYLAAARYLESEEAKNKAENEELDKLAEDLRGTYLDQGPGQSMDAWRHVARKAKELFSNEDEK